MLHERYPSATPITLREVVNTPLERLQTSNDQPPLPPLEQPYASPSEPTYPTGIGSLTFEQLYTQTSRIVGAVLCNQGQMNNPEDIDDCMQAGYLNVWKQLQKTPNLFEGKPKTYIVQAVVLRSKVQRYAHMRHYRKIVYDADAYVHPSGSDLALSQVDTWIDLAQVIQKVAAYTATLDNPIHLMALYALITDVKTQDVATGNGHGVSTLTAAKRSVRVTLARSLADYGKVDDSTKPLSLPKVRSFQLAQLQKQLISPVLLENIPLYPIDQSQVASNFRQPILTSQPQELQQPLTDQVEPTYTTQWKGKMTLGALLLDTQVRKVAFAKMRSLGYVDEDAQDCFQLGSINLWKALQKQPDLLGDKGPGWVGVWIAFSGSRRSLWKHKARCTSLDDPKHGWHSEGERDELYQRRRPERWASWATRVDQRIDFTMLMNALAQQYADDSLKLYALYSLTTSVKMKDILAAASADKNQLIHARHQVKQDIRQKLEIDNERYMTDEYCLEQLKRGENLECVTQVAEQVLNNQRLLLALYIVTTSATRKDVTELSDIKLTAFRREMREIKQMLGEQYRIMSKR